MIFHGTDLAGCYLIEPELVADERGFLMRSFDAEEFLIHGLNPQITQSSISYNKTEGTLRGLHFQTAPHQEAKLVRCIRGSMFDVVVDLRTHAATYLQWKAFALTAQNRIALYVPEGLAHGFMTQAPDTEVLYQISSPYHAAAAAGIRWNDPTFDIAWPGAPKCISARDAAWPIFRELPADQIDPRMPS